MLMFLPFVVALAAAAPVPAASSAPAPATTGATAGAKPTPLTEIGRVRALPACVPIVAHANGAITQALENDRTLAIISTNLHATDFDKMNVIQRRNAIETLMKQAEMMRIASSAGDVEVKKLREYANASPDPQRKVELKTFADALGGALYRQKKAAVEFMRDITILRGREEASDARDIMKANNPAPPVVAAQVSVRETAGALPPASVLYNKQMQYLGDTLDSLQTGVLVDEGVAADHSVAATSGC
jgi:hypothetical protein